MADPKLAVNAVVAFREMMRALVEPMSALAHDSFDGYVELDEIAGSDTEFVIRLCDETDRCTATLDVRQGPIVEGVQLVWGKAGDVEREQLLPLVPRALLGVLAY